MTLRLHDTATRSVRDFVPKTPGQVGIYLCGLTVQSIPHIGHLRSAVNYDVLRRWLLHTNHEVTFIRNITDVDDKILDKANVQGRPFWAIAYANKLVLDASYAALNVLPPTYEPLATAHIPEMHELIAELIERERAYPGEGGDVYFDVRSYADYGALSGQNPDDMRAPADGGEKDKRDYLDPEQLREALARTPSRPGPPSKTVVVTSEPSQQPSGKAGRPARGAPPVQVRLSESADRRSTSAQPSAEPS